MGIDHTCNRQGNVAFVVWDGVVTGEDWLRHVLELVSEPDWPVIDRFIVDLRTVTDTRSISDEEVERIVAIFSKNPGLIAGKKNAVIARDEFRKAKRFETLISRFGITTIVFNSLDTACTFLGISAEDTGQSLEQLRSRLRAGSGASLQDL